MYQLLNFRKISNILAPVKSHIYLGDDLKFVFFTPTFSKNHPLLWHCGLFSSIGIFMIFYFLSIRGHNGPNSMKICRIFSRCKIKWIKLINFINFLMQISLKFDGCRKVAKNVYFIKIWLQFNKLLFCCICKQQYIAYEWSHNNFPLVIEILYDISIRSSFTAFKHYLNSIIISVLKLKYRPFSCTNEALDKAL